jgi:hypothetical protein
VRIPALYGIRASVHIRGRAPRAGEQGDSVLGAPLTPTLSPWERGVGEEHVQNKIALACGGGRLACRHDRRAYREACLQTSSACACFDSDLPAEPACLPVAHTPRACLPTKLGLRDSLFRSDLPALAGLLARGARRLGLACRRLACRRSSACCCSFEGLLTDGARLAVHQNALRIYATIGSTSSSGIFGSGKPRTSLMNAKKRW